MAKTPEQMKNMITEWCDEIKEPYNSMTLQEKGTQPIEWGLILGTQDNRIVVYVPNQIPTRVFFMMQINFADIHRKITREMKNKEYNDFMLKLTDRLTTYDVNWDFRTDGQQINDLALTKYLDESELTKANFFHMLDRCKVIKFQTLRTISFTLGGTVPTTGSGSGRTPGVV